MKQSGVHVDATDAVPAYPKFANTIAHALAVVKLFYKHLSAVNPAVSQQRGRRWDLTYHQPTPSEWWPRSRSAGCSRSTLGHGVRDTRLYILVAQRYGEQKERTRRHLWINVAFRWPSARLCSLTIAGLVSAATIPSGTVSGLWRIATGCSTGACFEISKSSAGSTISG